VLLHLGDGKGVLTVPLATLREPHLPIALLIRHGWRGRDAPRMPLTVKHPPRAEERSPAVRSWTLGTVFQLLLGLLTLFTTFGRGTAVPDQPLFPSPGSWLDLPWSGHFLDLPGVRPGWGAGVEEGLGLPAEAKQHEPTNVPSGRG
jgi:hypothetical protein